MNQGLKKMQDKDSGDWQMEPRSARNTFTSRPSIRERLFRDLPKSEEFRYDYDEEFQKTFIAAQIRALREDRGWTQTELAKRVKTGQSQISEMEGDYNSWSVRTLRKLAREFGVRLSVSFESWGELIPRVESFRRENLIKPEIKDDPAFQTETTREDLSDKVARALSFLNIQTANTKPLGLDDFHSQIAAALARGREETNRQREQMLASAAGGKVYTGPWKAQLEPSRGSDALMQRSATNAAATSIANEVRSANA